MSADAANRKTVRKALANLFTTNLVGTGKPVQAVYEYPFEITETKETPVIILASSGSARQISGINDTRWKNVFVIECFTFVRTSDKANGWGDDNIEDSLDDIDKAIADVVADNRANANWSFIGFTHDMISPPPPSEIVTDTKRGYKFEMRKIYIHYLESG